VPTSSKERDDDDTTTNVTATAAPPVVRAVIKRDANDKKKKATAGDGDKVKPKREKKERPSLLANKPKTDDTTGSTVAATTPTNTATDGPGEAVSAPPRSSSSGSGSVSKKSKASVEALARKWNPNTLLQLPSVNDREDDDELDSDDPPIRPPTNDETEQDLAAALVEAEKLSALLKAHESASVNGNGGVDDDIKAAIALALPKELKPASLPLSLRRPGTANSTKSPASSSASSMAASAAASAAADDRELAVWMKHASSTLSRLLDQSSAIALLPADFVPNHDATLPHLGHVHQLVMELSDALSPSMALWSAAQRKALATLILGCDRANNEQRATTLPSAPPEGKSENKAVDDAKALTVASTPSTTPTSASLIECKKMMTLLRGYCNSVVPHALRQVNRVIFQYNFVCES
jgi:hypothetical protein